MELDGEGTEETDAAAPQRVPQPRTEMHSHVHPCHNSAQQSQDGCHCALINFVNQPTVKNLGKVIRELCVTGYWKITSINAMAPLTLTLENDCPWKTAFIDPEGYVLYNIKTVFQGDTDHPE